MEGSPEKLVETLRLPLNRNSLKKLGEMVRFQSRDRLSFGNVSVRELPNPLADGSGIA